MQIAHRILTTCQDLNHLICPQLQARRSECTLTVFKGATSSTDGKMLPETSLWKSAATKVRSTALGEPASINTLKSNRTEPQLTVLACCKPRPRTHRILAPKLSSPQFEIAQPLLPQALPTRVSLLSASIPEVSRRSCLHLQALHHALAQW